jgi:hypothetical protein
LNRLHGIEELIEPFELVDPNDILQVKKTLFDQISAGQE